VARRCYRAAPDAVARLGHAVAHALDPRAPAVSDLPSEASELAEEVAAALASAVHPLVVSGAGAGSLATVRAAANVAWALTAHGRPAQLAYALPECNSAGLGLLGGLDLEAALALAEEGRVDALVVVENDLYRRASARDVDRLLRAVPHLIVIDHTATATGVRAEAVLPAATFAEGDGTLVNAEGRAQRFYQVLLSEKDVQESWRWVRDLLTAAGRPEGEHWASLDDITGELAQAVPLLAPVRDLASPPDFRGRTPLDSVPRQSHRYSGRTAILADRTVHEPKPPRDPDSPLVFSMEGRPAPIPPAFIPLIWAPGWNSVQAVTKLQAEVSGPLEGGDPGRRLFEPMAGASPVYFAEVPPPFSPRPGQLFVVALSHVFGSEELSSLSPPLATLIPGPYLALNEGDLPALGLVVGETAWLELSDARLVLPLRVGPGLPPGLAGLPSGLPGLPSVSLPAWATIRRTG